MSKIYIFIGKAKERVMSDPAEDSGGDAVKSSSSKSQSWESDFGKKIVNLRGKRNN